MTDAPDLTPLEPEGREPEGPERLSLSYARAVDELEAILDELEDDNLDVDRLAERVGRAATLIRLCRERIGHTRLEVERIMADLDGAGTSPTEVEPPGDAGSPSN